MIKFGNTEISSIFYGNSEISAVYKGSTLVWQKQPDDPRGPSGFYILSGTGAYAKYNGYWGSTWQAVYASLAMKKEDTYLTGNPISTYLFADKHFPDEGGGNTENLSIYAVSDALAKPYFYSFNSVQTNIPFSGVVFTNEDFSDPTYGSFTCPSTTFYNGDREEVTSGGTPGVLISSHLWEVPFDEKYKTLVALNTNTSDIGIITATYIFNYLSGTTWADPTSTVFLEAGYWVNGAWVNDKKLGWCFVNENRTAGIAGISGQYAWPWITGHNRWRFLSLTETPIYGYVCFVPIADTFVGFEVSGAQIEAYNGIYVPSGTYDGYQRYQKRDGEEFIRYNDGYYGGSRWEITRPDDGVPYYSTYIMGQWNYESYQNAPAPYVRLYLKEYESGGGGGGGTGTVIYTCTGGDGSITLNGVTKAKASTVTFDDVPEGEYTAVYNNMGSGTNPVVVVGGETTYATANFPCFVAGTQIRLANGKDKNVEDITYDDELLVWDFDNACYSSAKPVWIMKEMQAPIYMLSKYADGRELKTVGPEGMHHEIFNADEEKFDYTDNMQGHNTMTLDGKTTCVSCELVKEDVKFYNIITSKHFNLFSNGILTSCRLNNIYKIKDMKFVKDEKHFEHPALSGLNEEFLDGLRISELDESYDNYIIKMNSNKLL